MADSLREYVKRRANDVCEYCQLPQKVVPFSHELDHIIAVKHRGPTAANNLAWACFGCSRHKSCNIAGIDPKSGSIIRLFHPRRHKWATHFRWNGPVLVGRTDIGRATIEVLEINLPRRIALRQSLIDDGSFDPTSA
ncbi:MAG TPA: HNH endonuclease signature motif containing protein [Gemmataceae bacterium]|nr:HNH endonuclease signature motif containing protein [Gemmataceae bacterium]